MKTVTVTVLTKNDCRATAQVHSSSKLKLKLNPKQWRVRHYPQTPQRNPPGVGTATNVRAHDTDYLGNLTNHMMQGPIPETGKVVPDAEHQGTMSSHLIKNATNDNNW
eukprot:5068143-Amphidinium_carterae.1